MKAYNELMYYLEDYTGEYWNQMVEVNNPALDKRISYWEDRILQQLRFAMAHSVERNHQYNALIEEVSSKLLRYKQLMGYITKEQVLEAEKQLTSLGEILKSYKVHCVAHAHIDMNWMWGFQETVAATIDTFKTMLQLMKEYKNFTYSQSQASTYKIIEEYCPEMIEEIKKYVREGRWELAASTWVENDRNMSSSESFARHILYTKNYLSKLFDIDVDMLQLDFEPDCFGHSANIPEILANGGVKYYYHCRGLEDQTLYKWKAPSGASVLSYREPLWYAHSITGNSFAHIPKICETFGVKDGLFVYGVGDHGGGPTRRDIEKLLDMNTWPIYPVLLFSTYHNYFKAVEPFEASLPVVDHELNFVLTGCLTSSSRIKMANRYSENALVDTEYINTVSHALFNRPYQQEAFTKTWYKALFNQFHDILPGCGINFTREYALGQFQEIMAKANTIRKLELEYLVSQIDTTKLINQEVNGIETSEGAGVGVGSTRGIIGNGGISFNVGLSQVGRYGGQTRLFTLFNYTPYHVKRYVEVIIWDYRNDTNNLIVYSSQGEVLKFERSDAGYNQYWGHWYTKLLVEVAIPSYGYETIKVTQKEDITLPSPFAKDKRTNQYLDYTLENEVLRATFDPESLALVSLYNKKEEKEYLDTNFGGDFNYVQEEGENSNAWVVGKYVATNKVKKEVSKVSIQKGIVAQTLSYILNIAGSKLEVTVHLNGERSALDYHVKAIWNEIGSRAYTPQLNYKLNLKEHNSRFIYDVPMGRVERGTIEDDVPGNNYGMAYCTDAQGVYIATESKYGYRGLQNSLALTLLRSSSAPDTHPETGTHLFDFVVGFGDVEDAQREGMLINHNVDVVGCKVGQKGSLEQRKSFLTVEGEGIVITCIKKTENLHHAWIIRLYEVNGEEKVAQITFPISIKEAYEVDFLERKKEKVTEVRDQMVTFTTKPYGITTLLVVQNEK